MRTLRSGKGPYQRCQITLHVLSVFWKMLCKHMPELSLTPNTTLVLHKNRLSCTPPNCSTGVVNMSLVAVDNHLSCLVNGTLPSWLSPFERDGLFLVSQGQWPGAPAESLRRTCSVHCGCPGSTWEVEVSHDDVKDGAMSSNPRGNITIGLPGHLHATESYLAHAPSVQ